MSCVRHIHNHKLGDNHGTKRIVVSQEIHVDEEWYFCCMHRSPKIPIHILLKLNHAIKNHALGLC